LDDDLVYKESFMEQLLVGIDVGCRRHRVAVGMPDGTLIDQFDLDHQPASFDEFFLRVGKQAEKLKLPVSVGMEGYGGWARPLDEMVIGKGWTLLNVNNLKLARYKEIFPSPAKTDAIDARKILELMRLRPLLPQAKEILNEVIPAPQVHHDMKLLTRRRRQLVNERTMLTNRMHSDLQAIAPGLLEITRQVDSKFPFGRLIIEGEFSGECLLKQHLIPALKNYNVVTVVLDGTCGYAASFLEEAFGGLSRNGFTKQNLHRRLNLVSENDAHLAHEIWGYIDGAE